MPEVNATTREDGLPAAGVVEFKWLPIPPDFWVPEGLKDFQQAWFINLIRASLRSENTGYLILCKEGCSGCPACLWRVANAHHPEHFKKHGSLVLACFNSAQIAGHRVLYFPKLMETIKRQLSRIKNHRSRRTFLSETYTGFNRGGGICSPSGSLSFDFDLDSKKQEKTPTASDTREGPSVMEEKPNSERTAERDSTEIVKTAQRIIKILGLTDVSMRAAIAAVEERVRQTELSMDGIVQKVVTDANRAEREERTEKHEFLEKFLSEKLALQILRDLALVDTKNHVSAVAASVRAEVRYTGLGAETVAERITKAALEARGRGERIDRFYFDDVKWRQVGISNVKLNKAEQRKLDNLEVNARVQQRLREKFGNS